MLGIINLCYSLIAKQSNIRFHIGMFAGLLLVFLGDILIDYDFIMGAFTFAILHFVY